MESDAEKPDVSVRPILSEGIGRRISEVAKAIGDRKTAASVAGISADTLQRYIRGEVQPSFDPIARMAIKTGIRLDWIATGLGPKFLKEHEAQRFDVGTLAQAVKVVETRLKLTNGVLDAEARAKVTADIYQLLIDEGGDEKSRADLILTLLSRGV